MRCDRVQVLYDEYTRGELDFGTSARVDEHLAACESCREFFEQNDQLAQLLRTRTDVPHPGPGYFDALYERVVEAVEADSDEQGPTIFDANPPSVSESKWRRPFWWTGAMAAAALFAVILLPSGVLERAPQLAPAVSVSSVDVASAPTIPAESEQAPEVTVIKNDNQETGQATLELAVVTGSEETENIQPYKPAGTTLDKGMTGQSESEEDTRQLLMSAAVQSIHQNEAATSGIGIGKGLGAETRKEEPEADMTAVKIEPKGAVETRERFDPIALLRDELLSDKNDGTLVERLERLDRALDERSPDLDRDGLGIAKQVRLYLGAEDALAAGNAKEAFSLYRRILMVDEQSPLSRRADMHLADLCYSEWADFDQAHDYYERALGRGASQVLSDDELAHARQQLDRLERYGAGNWYALELLHVVRLEGMAQALAALRQLSEAPEAADLMPEAARTIVGRLGSMEEHIDAADTRAVYHLLNDRASRETDNEIRAWLELAVGDLALEQFQDDQQAMSRYREAVTLAPGTGASRVARLKIDDLIEQSLVNHLR